MCVCVCVQFGVCVCGSIGGSLRVCSCTCMSAAAVCSVHVRIRCSGGASTHRARGPRTSGAGCRAVGPGLVVPGEAHLVVPAPRTLDGHVELVADALVLLLEQHLHGGHSEGECCY